MHRIGSGLVFVLVFTLACSAEPELFEKPPAPTADAGTTNTQGSDSGVVADDPWFTITAPTDGSLTTNAEIEISGEAGDLAEVTVDGASVPVTNGRWQTYRTYAEGAHEIVVAAATLPSQVISVQVDLAAPTLEILDPPRGAFIEADGTDRIRVTGRVSDTGSGVASLSVDGISIPVTGETFTIEIDVDEGVNLIEAIATDEAGRTADVLQAAIYGEFIPFGEAMPDAMSVALNASVFEDLENQFEQGLLAALSSTTAFGNTPQFQITSVTVAALDFEMTPRTGFFDFAFVMDDVRIDFDVDTVVLGQTIRGPGVITIQRFDLTTEAHLRVDAAGEMVGQFEDSEATITNLTLTIQGVAPFITQTLANIVRPQLEAGFIEQIEQTDLPALFDFSQFLPQGSAATITTLDIDPTGVTIVADAGFEQPQDPATPVAPGVLVTRSAPPVGAPANAMVRLGLSDDLTNNILFNTWRAGTLTTTVAGPDAGTLALALSGEVLELAPPGTPVRLDIRPLLPPVTTFDGTSSVPSVRVEVGDLLVDFSLVPENEAPIRFATFAAQILLVNDLTTDGTTINASPRLEVRIDLADAPLFPIDEATVEGFLGDLLGGLGSVVLGGGNGGLPIDPAAGLANIAIEVDDDYLVVTGDLANP